MAVYYIKHIKYLVLIPIILTSYSCAATYTPVYPEPVNIKTIIKTGDTVIVTTKDGNEYEFEVVEITDEAIVGENEEVLFEDIYKLQQMATSGEIRTGQVVGAVVIYAPLILIDVIGEKISGTSILSGFAQPSYKPDVTDVTYESAKKKGVCIYPDYLSLTLIEVLTLTSREKMCKGEGTLVYAKYHPGDWLIYETEHVRVEWGLLIKGSWGKCEKPCSSADACEYSGDYSCTGQYGNISFGCMDTCLDEIYKSKSIAEHIEGGYYTDGSYYATLLGAPFIRNIHPTRINYQKTKWQKYRDECMELTAEKLKTAEKVKVGRFTRPTSYISKGIKKGSEYYRNCLKVRGYDIK